MTRLLKKLSRRMDTDRGSLSKERVALEPMLQGPVNWSKISKMMEDTLTHLAKKQNARTVQVTEEPLVGIMEIVDSDHNSPFVQGTV